MTTRDHASRGRADVRADAPRAPIAADAAPSLPERLYAARERKGVDLYRAERDTKIRARYLGALERGDYRELPGAVYTKGFLRNYALYLGLDPEDVLRQWRRERGDVREAEPIVVPQALAAPRPGLTFSPGVVWAALLTVAVLAFGVYLAIQLLRFAKPPTLAVTDPAVAVTTVEDSTESYVLHGTSIGGATISVSTPGRDQPYRVSAGADGRWAAEVDLRRGQNQFDITATDPDTGKQAENPAQVLIRVPFLVFEAPTLRLDQPADGATFENGASPVQGLTTNATKVVVSAKYVGPPPAQGSGAGAGAAPSTAPPPAPPQVTAKVADDGTFAAPFDLVTGRWTLTVTASSAEGKTVALTRTITVAYKGVNLVVNLKGTAWLKVWVDDRVVDSIGAAGATFRAGKTLTFTAQRSIEIRTGSSGVTFFTVNGTPLGALGRPGIPETWLFAPPTPPQKTRRT
ncbi:MAG TPA: helix-turn-helix domain-containing protein [Candidatus Limnocylindrales bacterium]|nr:helix-turn-helix domain-containing protein [Candidatus Limnocylindrales bacterium]